MKEVVKNGGDKERCRWSKEEIDYLENAWGQVSMPSIASHLGRTVNAVKVKAVRLGLGAHIHGGVRITFYQLCKAIGKKNSYSSIKKTWLEHGFPVTYQRCVKNKWAMVDIEDFWKWAENHKTLVDFSLIEKGILGKEPKWVDEARHASFVGRVKATKWTKSEDDMLIALLKQYKYSYNDLCIRLNRTEGAIKRRIATLRLPYRPVRNYDRQWQDEEIKTLLRMREQGHCFDEIGRALKRSGSAVRGKYERLQNPEYRKRYYRRQREMLADYFQKDFCVHHIKTIGCELCRTNCDICTAFVRRKPSEKPQTGWNSIDSASPAELLNQRIGGK